MAASPNLTFSNMLEKSIVVRDCLSRLFSIVLVGIMLAASAVTMLPTVLGLYSIAFR